MQVVIKAGPDCEHFNSGWFVNIGGQQLNSQRRALRGSTMFVLMKNSGPSGNFAYGGGGGRGNCHITPDRRRTLFHYSAIILYDYNDILMIIIDRVKPAIMQWLALESKSKAQTIPAMLISLQFFLNFCLDGTRNSLLKLFYLLYLDTE